MARSSSHAAWRCILSTVATCAAVATLGAGCAAEPESGDEPTGTTDSAMSRSIHSSYGITVFGGPGDYQPMACGLHSRNAQSSQPWYVASSQRYGCRAKIKLTTAAGKCVVVRTEDAGPATWVENKAGTPILDVSPAASRHLFGTASIGWSDLRRTGAKYKVTAARTTLPLGPCDGTASAPDPASPAAPSPAAPSPDPPGSAATCGSDGQCNPGNDGAGLICEGGQCVPGCRQSYHCPGVKRCISGQCQ